MITSRATALSADQIVAAGTSLADRDGLAAVSMRRVAAELGAGAMSLYRHVEDKDALIRLMITAVMDRAPYPRPIPSDWRAAVTVAAEIDWAVYRRHPWTIPVIGNPRYYSDEHCLEWMREALLPLTSDVDLARGLTRTVWSFVQGASLFHIDTQRAPDARDDAARERDFRLGLAVLLDGIAARGGSGPAGSDAQDSAGGVVE